MVLHVNGVAKVSQADILLEGMTVIAGENGTGKSTVSRALMAVASMSSNMKALVDAERAASILREAIEPVLSAEGVQIMLRGSMMAGRLEHLLDRSLWENSLRTKKFVSDVIAQQNDSLFAYPEAPLIEERLGRVASQLSEKTLRILDVAEDEYVRYVLEKNLPLAFMGAMSHVDGRVATSSLSLINDRFGISVTLDNGKVSAFDGWGAKPFSTLFYSEPKHKLDDVDDIQPRRRRGIDRYSTQRSLASEIFHPAPPSESLAEAGEYEKTMALVAQLASRLHGQLKNDNQRLAFQERFSSGEFFVPLAGMASGAKTMATVLRLLENKTILPGGLIIIDEPESNLHPEYQILFAEFLVRLCDERNIKLLVNTHSPYLLRALQKFSAARAVKDRCHYYMMLPDEMNVGDDVSSRTFHAQKMDDSVESIYSSLAKPLEDVL